MKVNQTICDLCGKEIRNPDASTRRRVKVVFETEQTEGRLCKPYMDDDYLDFCNACFQKYVELYPIRARGAQGHNKYRWRSEK